MTELWEAARFYVAMGLLVVAFIGYALEAWAVLAITAGILLMWTFWAAVLDAEREHIEWERRYATMSDQEKIDHHLDMARRHHSNVDANIAQALIERNR